MNQAGNDVQLDLMLYSNQKQRHNGPSPGHPLFQAREPLFLALQILADFPDN